jgi:gamma-glutamyltranspeptidase / glutathione hydrolase
VPAVGTRGAVAAEHRLAAEAGVEMLAAGGNAIDAAVATAFASGVVNPSSSGIGGGGFLLAVTARDGKVRAIDFRERAPERATRDMYVRDGRVDPQASLRGALAVAVPGEVRGLAEALKTLGTLPLARVLAPAIRLASEGFPVGTHLASVLAKNRETIRSQPALAAIYLKADGTPYAAGERFTNEDLAGTLRSLAEHGPEVFYSGDIGKRIVDTIASAGGIMTTRDLLAYKAVWREPLRVSYRGHEVLGFPPPSSGGGVVLEILNVLGGFEAELLRERSPRALHVLAEASKLAFADRAREYGDPDFVNVPLDRLLSPKYATELRQRISLERALPTSSEPSSPKKGGTSHLSVIDAAGTAAALTTTINTAFGSMLVVPGTGIVLNNEMDDFSVAPGVANVYGLIGSEANSIRPGKRPLSSMAPTIVRRKGKVVLVAGASGGPHIISSTLETLLDVVDGGLPLEKALAAPRIHHQWVPNLLFVEPTLEREARDGLERLGHRVTEAPEIGAVQAVAVSPAGLVGVGDPRKGGGAAAW